jgi:carboxyl-terminal processing protease
VIIALTAALGYVAGTNHYQIEAAIGPVFGYNAHAGDIDLSSLQQTYNELASNYDGKLDTTKLIQGANRGLVDAAGDTYTIYMSPQESTDYGNNLTGNIGGGIGAVVGIKNNQITIMSVLDNNPAKTAGLIANDTITKINDQSTAGYSVEKAVGLIRGEEGTTVKLTVQRGSEVKDYTITRAIINNPSVVSSVSDGLGTLTISRFDAETGNLAQIAAQDFKKQGVKSIILDLRDNPGGYVDAARDVASLWLDNKVIVTERSGSTIKSTIKSGSNALLAGIPTVVLVNGSSASASEIVAGALQDYKVAKLVGVNTFGKGSVQKLIALDDGAELKVTVARWFTPNGKNITNGGIAPDTTANLTQADVDKGVDPQVDAAKKILGL